MNSATVGDTSLKVAAEADRTRRVAHGLPRTGRCSPLAALRLHAGVAEKRAYQEI
jgi:hypothetical protein